MRILILVALASRLDIGHGFFFGSFTKPSYKPSYRPGSSIFRPSLPIEDWKPQYGEYGPNDFLPTSSTETEKDEKPQYFDDKPMYIEDKPLYVNLRPKPKPIFPQIKIPPFDVLKHFLAKLALLKNHFLGKLNFFGGIFGRPPKKQLYKPKPGYRPSRPSYKPRPNRPTRKPTPSRPTTTTTTARPSYSTPSDSYGAPWGDLLPVVTTGRPITTTKPPRSTFFPLWPPRPPSSGYGAPWDDVIRPPPPSTSPPRRTTAAYPSLTLPPYPPLDSYGAPLSPLLPSSDDQPLIYDNLIGPRFPQNQRPSAQSTTTPTPWRLGSYAYPQVNRQPAPASQTLVVEAAKIGPAVAPLDGYGAPLATVVVTSPQPIISLPSAATTEVLSELPLGEEAARAVRPLDGYGAPHQGLVVGIKSNQKGEDVSPSPEPELPEGFQSSNNQWKPMKGPSGVSRSMRMENKEKEGHTVRAEIEVEADPSQTLIEWVMTANPNPNPNINPTPNPGYRPAAVTGTSVQMSPPTEDRGTPWDKGESNDAAEFIETTTTKEDIVGPSLENLRDLMVESTTKKTDLEDTLYTIFLEIMNETMAANFETTTPTVPGRPESIADIISFIKDVTNNTENFRSQQSNDLTDNDLLKVGDTFVTTETSVTHDVPTEDPGATTTEGKHLKESPHFIMGQGINGFITGIVQLQEDARFLYDPKTGTLVGREKRRS